MNTTWYLHSHAEWLRLSYHREILSDSILMKKLPLLMKMSSGRLGSRAAGQHFEKLTLDRKTLTFFPAGCERPELGEERPLVPAISASHLSRKRSLAMKMA